MPKNNINNIIKIYKELEDCKICCKVSIIESLNSKYVNKLTNCIKSCLECIEACDVCQYFIASNSKNMKQCITFTIAVLKTCILECNKSTYDSHLKKVHKDTTSKKCMEFLKSLQKLKSK